MFKDKKAGAGGMVASTGESMYVGISSDLIHGTSDVQKTPLYQKALQANQKNTQKILDSQTGREFKQLAVELEAISISQKNLMYLAGAFRPLEIWHVAASLRPL